MTDAVSVSSREAAREMNELKEFFMATLNSCYLDRNPYYDTQSADVEEVLGRFRSVDDRIRLFASKWVDELELEAELEGLLHLVHSHEFKRWKECENTGRIGNEDVTRGVVAARLRTIALIRGIVKEMSIDPVNDSSGTLTWNGNASELCELIVQLAENGWVKEGRSRKALAERIHAIFRKQNGDTMDLQSLIQYMKPSAHRPTRKGVLFQVPKDPTRN